MRHPLIKLEAFQSFSEGLDHPEGVACSIDGTIYAGGEAGQIYRVSDSGKVEQIACTGGFVLGICLDAADNVYACDIKHNVVFRITPAGDLSVYSRGTKERPMVNPNYPVFDSAGNLLVSASGHWNQNDGCVYRISPSGETSEFTDRVNQFPNGLALSADGRKLYVVQSTMPGVACVEIQNDGSAGEIGSLLDLPETVPDGLALDINQNLYISCYAPDIIYRRSPSGELVVLAEDRQHVVLASPTNLAFCGQDRRQLVAANLGRWHLARTQVEVAGQRLNYPRLA
jgi:gluconolactonase